MTNGKPSGGEYDEYRRVFNWTMTYRHDSDVFDPYGKCTYIPTNTSKYRIAISDGQRAVYSEDQLRMNLTAKSKFAVWFVTNKHGSQVRFTYVKEMMKYVKIDFYGQRESFKCPKKDREHCLDLIDKNYKFYLAFENSFCYDYITEKLFYHLGRFTIPVVFGGADYKRLLPPNSYIDAGEFQSPKELAEYLLLLDRNDDLYMKYFQWMLKGRWEVDYDPDNHNWCQLCEKLVNRNAKDFKVYQDIYDWYYNKTLCIEVQEGKHPRRHEIERRFNYGGQ
ncbi:FUT7 (predicted) [Pycnogonum litorale]